MPFLSEISNWLENTLGAYGAVGLMLIAVCDSSFLSLPEVNDILLMAVSIEQPERMLIFAAFTTLGSVIGCAMLYSVGRKGGEAFLKRRFSSTRLAYVRDWYSRYGVLAVIVPSLLPPPTPFKIFVLSAGAFGISWLKFLSAVLVGRGIRYFSQGILAVLYGEAAIDFVKENFGSIGLALAAALVLSAVTYVVWQRRAGTRH